jgi:hypothetical protein
MNIMMRAVLFCVLGLLAAANTWAETNAYQQWRATLFDTLAKTKDPNDYLAQYLLSGHDSDGDIFLRRAYAADGGNAKTLWTAAIALPCPDACEKSAAAAHELVKVDSGNALAWMTLAFVVERDLGATTEMTAALQRAAKAPRLHDYGFDLMKVMLAATARVPISPEAIAAAPGRPGSQEEFQLQHGDGSVTVGSHVVMEWIEHGCTSRSELTDQVAEAACQAASKAREHGDSLATLGNTDNGLKLRDTMRTILAANISGHSEARLTLYAAATSEREFIERLAQTLAH